MNILAKRIQRWRMSMNKNKIKDRENGQVDTVIILPCPFCGEKDRVHYATEFGDKLGQIKCFNCGARVGGDLQTREEAIYKWNTRSK